MTGEIPAVEIRELGTLDECRTLDPFFEGVWGTGTPPLGVEVLRVLAHTGGYVAGAYVGGDLVGASVGFLAQRGERSLHSHVTGVAAAARGRGVGALLKAHQRQWALDRGIGLITWTCDPLVRRNSWFNIVKLGALPGEYLVDFYGPMGDAINGSDESDRLLMEWPVTPHPAAPEPEVGTVPAILACREEAPVARASDAERVLVATPADIEGLRQHSPDLARRWRSALRAALAPELATGRVVGFTRAGEYVVRRDAAAGGTSGA
ncbi:GNAT family N-acetyltransferase [Nocardioides cynanchi]|uniref:GNAT family N-acetyltransferase n=1 Tax=Nocardioides cynanchi TaxID=2558918 RepID=UPI001245A0E5|nr:GNAT family N-acetyltransferase [Nocardioides cynanchi]